jgi:hypothetical protein
MAELLPMLTHLQRPGYCGKIHVDRFSPLFTSPEFGITDPRPASAYSYVYPLNPQQLGNLAYFFEFDYSDARKPAEYARAVTEAVARWPAWTSPDRPRLDLFQTGSLALITDTRPCAVRPTYVLSGVEAKLYLECDTAQTPASIGRKLGNSIPELEVRALLHSFRDARLMAEMDGRYLSLAVLRNRAAQKPVADEPVMQTLSLVNILAAPQSRRVINEKSS